MLSKNVPDFTAGEISINSLLPGIGMPFYPQHQGNEGANIFIQDKGQMQIDKEIIDVQEGSIVRIAPSGLRRINPSESMQYTVAQMRENSLRQYGFEDDIVPKQSVTWGRRGPVLSGYTSLLYLI